MMYAANIMLNDDCAGAHTNGWSGDKGEFHPLLRKFGTIVLSVLISIE